MEAMKELWNEYRRTYQAFARDLARLQELMENQAASEEIGSALLTVERARATHNEARDRLAATLQPSIVLPDSPAPHGDQHVRTAAKLLWELSGKPENSSDSNWYRAERVMRAAG